MKTACLAAVGLLLPGGAFLLSRRYRQFAIFAALVSISFAAGIILHGAWRLPQPAELDGLDGFDTLVAWAGALTRLCAGVPSLAIQIFGGAQAAGAAQLHEYGTTLLTMAGLFNLLGVSSALEIRG